MIEPLKVVCFGTPAYAVPALERLASDPRFDVMLVVTQPDRPAGRGRRLTAPAMKPAAEALSLPLYQPQSLKTEDARAPLRAAAADLFVVAAYGLIFGLKTLAIPRIGCVNLHASLLPAYRGAAPVAAAILNGDQETGVSLMLMERGLDTGPVVATREIAIAADDTMRSLTSKLGIAGAELVGEELIAFARGGRAAVPQDDARATIVRPLLKSDGWIDWNRSASHIERAVRAFWDWPRAFTTVGGQTLQIHRSSVVATRSSGVPGEVRVDGKEVTVATSRGSLRLEMVQMAGGSPVEPFVLERSGLFREGVVLGRAGGPQPPPPLIRPAIPSGG